MFYCKRLSTLIKDYEKKNHRGSSYNNSIIIYIYIHNNNKSN